MRLRDTILAKQSSPLLFENAFQRRNQVWMAGALGQDLSEYGYLRFSIRRFVLRYVNAAHICRA
jgi:hypothetical protein